MTVTRRTTKTVAAGFAVIAAALTGSPVGQRDDLDCPFTP